MKVIQSKNIRRYSQTDRRFVLELNEATVEEISKPAGTFLTVARYGTKPNRYRVYSRLLQSHGAVNWAEWIETSEKVEVFLLPITEEEFFNL